MSFNLSVILRESARRSPENPAIIDTGGVVSYRDLDSRSDHIASGLVRLGIQPGDAVGVQLPNVREFVEIMYGILKAGAVLVPFNVLNKGPEIAYALTDADVKVLIASASTAGEALRGTAEAGLEDLIVVGGDHLPTGARPYTELAETQVHTPPPYAVCDPGTTAVLLYT